MNSAVIERVKKLLALSKSDNANEAAAAMAVAQRLMSEHQIAEAELETCEPDERAQVEVDPLDVGGVTLAYWKGSLGCGLAKIHGCRAWTTRGKTGAKVLVIVGRPSDVATVRYLYAWLVLETERLAQRNAMGGGRSYADSYRKGCVAGILAAMRQADSEVRATATGSALMRLDARRAECEALLPENLRKTQSRVTDGGAFSRGREHGSRIHTGGTLGASRTRLLS